MLDQRPNNSFKPNPLRVGLIQALGLWEGDEMASYMQQQLFDMCAVSAGKISVVTGRSIDSVALELSQYYHRWYQDTNLADDIAAAAQEVSAFVQGVLPPDTLAGNLAQLQFCIKHYETDGRKRRRKIFSGTFFNKD